MPITIPDDASDADKYAAMLATTKKLSKDNSIQDGLQQALDLKTSQHATQTKNSFLQAAQDLLEPSEGGHSAPVIKDTSTSNDGQSSAGDGQTTGSDVTSTEDTYSDNNAPSQISADTSTQQDDITNTNTAPMQEGDSDLPPETPSDSSGSALPGICDTNFILDKRVRLFRTQDHVLWCFFVDAVIGKNSTKYSLAQEDGSNRIDVESLSNEESVLFFTKTDSETLTISTSGNLTTDMYWAVYYNPKDKIYKPIIGAKYFDLSYNKETEILDIVFWANVNIDDLTTATGDSSSSSDITLDTLYPDSLRNTVDVTGNIDTNAQRVLFYTRGQYKKTISTRKGKEILTGLFLFSMPRLLYNPGRVDQRAKSDIVLDQIPNFSRFVSFAG